MYIVLALFPIAAALVLMTRFRVSPGKALPLAFLATGVIGLSVWKMPLSVVAASSLQGLAKALDIILIIFGAILLLNVLKKIRPLTPSTILSRFSPTTAGFR